jgi:hypothetical protein
VISKLNRHDGTVPEVMTSPLGRLVARRLRPAVEEALGDTRVVLVNGSRQSGKSTLVRLVGAERDALWRTLDNEATRRAAEEDPVGFVVVEQPLVIDEIQRVPELFLAIKERVDRDVRPGRFLLTGSARVLGLRTDELEQVMAREAQLHALVTAERRVLEIQTKLHRWVGEKAGKCLRFDVTITCSPAPMAAASTWRSLGSGNCRASISGSSLVSHQSRTAVPISPLVRFRLVHDGRVIVEVRRGVSGGHGQ